MAKASIKDIEVMQRVEGIHLELTKDEAQMLVDILRKVGGHPATSRRGLSDSVREALDPHVEWESGYDLFGDMAGTSAGSLYFVGGAA